MNQETDQDRTRAQTSFVEDAIKYGLSRADALLCFDLVYKAKEEAITALERVCNTAPPHLQKVVLASALSNIYTSLRDSQEELDALAALSTMRARMG